MQGPESHLIRFIEYVHVERYRQSYCLAMDKICSSGARCEDEVDLTGESRG
jgi:hypothetical protein